MASGPNECEEWVGSAYLFVESAVDKVILSDAYAHPQKKVAVYSALRTSLAGAWVSARMEREKRAATVCGRGHGLKPHLLNSVGLAKMRRQERDLTAGRPQAA